MTLITIKVSGSKEMVARFTRLESKVKDFTPEFKSLGEYLVQYYSGEGFLSEGGVFQSRWPKLSSAYKSYKSKRYPGKQPLEATGTMRKAFKSTPGSKQLVISNPTPYFKYHQSSEPRTRLPRRVMIGWNNPIKSKATELISQGIERILHG